VTLLKPARLQPGDRVATVSLSWGGPGAIPHRYEAGKRQLEEAFGVRVVEMPHTLADPDWVAQNPEARADDLMRAFGDPSIKAIISTIGGDDSIRLLPYLDLETIRTNPKIFLGYSDSTITHFACYKAGLTSFYGPAIMAGFGENTGIFPYMRASVRKTLFSAQAPGEIEPNDHGWTAEFLDWNNPQNQTRPRQLNDPTSWRYLQGQDVRRGHLLGGCLEVLDWLRGTPVWPQPQQWQDALLFLETSEEAPPPEEVARFLRTLAAMDVLPRLAGILFGRPGGDLPPERFEAYDQALLQVVAREEGLTSMPIVTRMDFGHTDPMFVLPYGVQAQVDCRAQTFAILEAAVA
jgi:muramoyltetrapeptide carboxypeptidase LdcA involved in peptidoglycan recycling